MEQDMSYLPPAYEEVAAETWSLLGSGPHHLGDIAAHCRALGLIGDLVPEVFETDFDLIDDVVMNTPGIWITRPGAVARLDVLLSGRVFTHRLTDIERSAGVVTLDPDLSILGADIDDLREPLVLSDGREIRISFPLPDEKGDPSIVGPLGWLREFDAGSVVAFLKTDSARVDVAPANTIGSGQEEAAAIRNAFDAIDRDPGAGTDLWPLLIETLASSEDLFTAPIPPITELLESIGLEHRGEFIGPTDTEWLPPGAVRERIERAEIAAMFGFDACCHIALDTVIDSWRWSIGIKDTEPDAAAAAEALDHGDVTAAFIQRIEMRGGDLVDAGSFFEDLGERAGRHGAVPLERAAWVWFTDGDIESAIENAQAALALDRDLKEATIVLGHVAAIKGNYTEALRLLRRSFPEDAWVELLERIFEPFPDANRNDPCPCGSGSKFKVCCARTPKVSAIGRMHLLTHKVIAFLEVVQSPHLHYLAHVAASADERGDPNDIGEYVTHPFMIEIAAIEGSLDLFAGMWGSLLPQDEADTIDLWRASTRALWEVAGEPEGSYVPLRDTRTGDTVSLYDETMTPNLRPGDLLMGIIAPAFGEDRFLGNALRVDIRHREMTLALFDETPTDEELAHWFGLVTAPPILRTTEGQDMVICRAVGEPVSTWEALTEELDAHFEKDEDTNEWVATFVNDAGGRVLRGTLRREDSRLIIETMSEERLDDILDTLTGFTVIDESREPVDVPSRLEQQRGSDSISATPMGPEERAALTEIMQQREEAWLDEEIPVLGGVTPRQAAADPTRRGDLIALLDSFPAVRGDELVGFDGARLRRLLDLD